MFEIKVLRPDLNKAASSLNARLHAQPVTPAPESKPKHRPYGGLRTIRPAEFQILKFLSDHQHNRFPLASIANNLKFTRGVVASALKILVKNHLVEANVRVGDIVTGYNVTTAGYFSVGRVIVRS